ncbi:hypothetical protein HDK90DRAFT_478927, partial [Phyllosticta capitalensis]
MHHRGFSHPPFLLLCILPSPGGLAADFFSFFFFLFFFLLGFASFHHSFSVGVLKNHGRFTRQAMGLWHVPQESHGWRHVCELFFGYGFQGYRIGAKAFLRSGVPPCFWSHGGKEKLGIVARSLVWPHGSGQHDPLGFVALLLPLGSRRILRMVL